MGYPVQLANLKGKRALVVGGGRIAAQKLEGLIPSGIEIHLVAPILSMEVEELLEHITSIERREVREDDLVGKVLVIAATDDRDVNAQIAELARARAILVNAVDDPAASDFFVPAVVRRGPVTIALSTDGDSPLLAAQLRRLLEAAIPRSVETVGDLFSRIRKRGLRGLAQRSRLLRALVDPSISKLVDLDRTDEAEVRLEALMQEKEAEFPAGSVAIVGAGPGAKDLLTLRALDRIQRADVILHDALIEPEVLALALPDTRIIDVGRRCAGRTDAGGMAIEMAIALTIHEAKAGHRVVRLHAGDPFVFGRGGEEVDALAEAGITHELVPGISAVLAAPAAAQIPLTRRHEARGFSVRTGHVKEGQTRGELPRDEETVVILMGLGAARQVLAELVAEGYAPSTPAAAISQATRKGQRIVTGTIADLADQIEREQLESPTTLVVGKVAARAKRAVDTRPRTQSVA